MMKRLFCLLWCFLVADSWAFYSNARLSRTTKLTLQALPISRATFVSTILVATPVWAADTNDALKGTKQDPEFEACLGKCLYECTKPKGVEQKSRTECRAECKASCATTKAQLLKGTPIKP